MVIQEVYIGRIPEIEEIFQEFKKMRNEYKFYRTANNAKNTARLEKLIEDFWGFKAFSLDIDNNSIPNACTLSVSTSIDINPGKYIVSTSKGYRYTKECNASAMSFITKGLLVNKEISDEEVFAIFLHEIGHSFVHRSPMIIAQHEVYKNSIITEILYDLFLNLLKMNIIDVAGDIASFFLVNNSTRVLIVEFNKLVNKTPLLRELKITLSDAINSINSMTYNIAYLVSGVTGITSLANWIGKLDYNMSGKKEIEKHGHSQAYSRSAERLADNFATMYGFGNYISTGLIKLQDSENQGTFMRVTHNIPVLGKMLKKQDALAYELNGLVAAHRGTADRMLAILDNMQDDLAKDKTIPNKIKKELKMNITKQKEIIEDCKADEQKIYKHKNEYMKMVIKMGLKAGNSEDFVEKGYTDPDTLRKFYNDRKIRKEAALLESYYIDMYLDPDLADFIE